MERKHTTHIEINPESAMALFGEEGPLRLEVPGMRAEVYFTTREGGIFETQCRLEKGGSQEVRSSLAQSPSDAILALGDEVSFQVASFANQLPIE